MRWSQNTQHVEVHVEVVLQNVVALQSIQHVEILHNIQLLLVSPQAQKLVPLKTLTFFVEPS